MWSKVWFSSFISFDNEITMWLYYVVYICFGHTLRVCWLESKVGWNGSILDFHNGTHICVCLEGWSGSIFVFSWRDEDELITDCVSVCRCLASLSVKQAPLSLLAWACHPLNLQHVSHRHWPQLLRAHSHPAVRIWSAPPTTPVPAASPLPLAQQL